MRKRLKKKAVKVTEKYDDDQLALATTLTNEIDPFILPSCQSIFLNKSLSSNHLSMSSLTLASSCVFQMWGHLCRLRRISPLHLSFLSLCLSLSPWISLATKCVLHPPLILFSSLFVVFFLITIIKKIHSLIHLIHSSFSSLCITASC